MNRLIWYAGYGSNLLKSRFLCYIGGGQPEGAKKRYPGCSDKTEPRADKQIIIPYGLYFSKSSSIWEDKGVGFIKTQRNEHAGTLGRMYLITREQFVQVVRQENALEPSDKSVEIDFETTITNGSSTIPANWYSRIVYMGEAEAYPIFTFTGNWTDEEIDVNPPGDKYLTTIAKGIKECYSISDEEIINYLKLKAKPFSCTNLFQTSIINLFILYIGHFNLLTTPL